MRSTTSWQPTKFALHDGQWRGSRDPRAVAVSSRMVADRSACAYSSAIENFARGNLLDLGCGYVPLYGMYEPRVERIVCADWPTTLHPSPHLDVNIDLNQRLPFQADYFDTILLTDVLEHLYAPGPAMQEISRVLRAGGNAIIGVPFMYWLHEEPFDYFRYTEHALRRLCSDAHLEVVSLQPYGGGLDVVLDVIGKVCASKRFLAHVPGAINLAGHQLDKRRRRKAYHGTLPLGYVLVARSADGA